MAADEIDYLVDHPRKFAKLFMTIAAELCLRGRIETIEAVFQAAARNSLFGSPKD